MFTHPTLQNLSLLAGRALLSAIFIVSGFNKLIGFAGGGTQKYMEAMGVPGALLPLVIITELGFGLLVLIGFKTRLMAFLLAGFSLLTALMFHNKLGDQMQFIHFMKNVSIAGGFLVLMGAGAGAYSVDAHRGE